MLGNWHEVLTGVALVKNRGEKFKTKAICSECGLPAGLADAKSNFIESGELPDKAGA